MSDESRSEEEQSDAEGHILKHGAIDETPSNPDVHTEDGEDEPETEAHRYGGI